MKQTLSSCDNLCKSSNHEQTTSSHSCLTCSLRVQNFHNFDTLLFLYFYLFYLHIAVTSECIKFFQNRQAISSSLNRFACVKTKLSLWLKQRMSFASRATHSLTYTFIPCMLAWNNKCTIISLSSTFLKTEFFSLRV